MKTNTQLAVSQMCGIAEVSRAGYYRFREPVKPCPEDLQLRDAMHKVALEWPIYGSRLTEADALSMVAYLRSLPPVRFRVPENFSPGATPTGPYMIIQGD